MNSPRKILQEIFGYDNFRSVQKEIIDNVVAKRNSFVLMPTGGGKSLCYQVPAIYMKGVGVVISPLIALMEDQVMSLQQLGVKAYAINSSMKPKDVYEIKDKIRNNEVDIIYMSPERLLTQEMLTLLCEDNIEISLFAIDEAHCVSSWGHDFRPIYTKLTILADVFKDVPRIALTATADEATKKDIIQKLRLEGANSFISSFDRPNIRYNILQADKPKTQLLSFIKSGHEKESGIIYCISRKKVEEIAEFLQEKGHDALAYHAGMDAKKRKKHLEYFLLNENVIMVATIAFGMGIDKSNVRYVVHLNMPKNIESYYQETGRAGRDGLPSEVLMCYSQKDIALQRSFIEESQLTGDNQRRIEVQKLNSLISLCESSSCRRRILLNYFSEDSNPCNNCDNCLNPQETFDASIEVQKAISAVYRTNQTFGVNYIIDILLGKENERINRFNHQTLSVFGIGQDISKKDWQNIFRQIVALNYLKVDIENHGSLKITQSGRDFLRNKGEIRFKKVQKNAAPDKYSNKENGKEGFDDLNDKEKVIFNDLKDLRMFIAKSNKIPPYMIFHDKTLIELSKKLPKNKDEMLLIDGVGNNKIKKYGEAFIKKINSY